MLSDVMIAVDYSPSPTLKEFVCGVLKIGILSVAVLITATLFPFFR